MENREVTYLIFFVTIIFLVLLIFVLAMILNYYKRNKKYNSNLIDIQHKKDQEILKSQLEMQEHTFNTISTEIHDNVGQVLSLAKVQLNILDQGETLDKTLLADAKESVSKAMTDLRDIAKSLNSDRIQQSGLYEITEQELQRISRAGLMTVSINSEGSIADLPEQKKVIIFRMIQESLQNIIKHSKATNIDVCFKYEKEKVTISIADNGTGFDKTLLDKKDGLGLHNIFSRAALIGGEAAIHSVPGEGTIITIASPYE